MSANIRVGHADVTPDAPSHVDGVNEGNAPGAYESHTGHLSEGRSSAARSTGIDPAHRDPIASSMPNLSPA